MVQALPHCSSGCSTRWHCHSSYAHVAAARRSVLLLVLFACSPSRVGQFSKKKSIFSQDFVPISDRFLIRNFRNSIRTPLVFDKESPQTWSRADFGRVVPVPGSSHWDKPLGQAQSVPVGQADWDMLYLSQWDKYNLSQLGLGKVKRDLSLSHRTSHIPTLEAFPCPGASSIPTMELVPIPLVPTCPTKWVYKAVQYFDFVKGFAERSMGKKVQDPVLSCFENSRWISREISGLDIICIFYSLCFSVISP